MKAEALLELYGRVAEAPDAIVRLRRFVLDLAVRGKLVEQDAHDETVETALRRREALPASQEPFPIPRSWAWVELQSVSTSRLGKMLDRAKNKGELKPYLRNINVRWLDFDLSDLQLMPFEEGELSELRLESGDVLVCEGGEPGRAAVWDSRADHIYFQKALHRVRFCELVDPNYFVRALRSSADEGRLAACFTGTGIKHLTGKGLAKYSFPLPPLPEQHRIVAKVNELMALLDRLEAARSTREATRDRFTAAALGRLTAADADPESLRTHARFAQDALPALTTRTDQIKQIRQSILSLAVTGTLVDQRTEDEPAASSFRKHFTAQQANKYGNKSRLSEECLADASASPSSMPRGWMLTTLGEVGEWGSGSTPSRSQLEYYGGGITWLKSGELGDSTSLCGSEETLTERASEECSFRKNKAGDVLIAMYGATIGKLAILGAPAVTNQAVCGCTPHPFLSNRYLFLFLLSKRSSFHAASEGGAQPNISKVKIVNTPILLPPLAEQHRIVAKAEELMAICDRLEEALQTTAIKRLQLLEAVLRDALSSDSTERKAA